MKMPKPTLITLFCAALMSWKSDAATYDLPAEGSRLIGRIQHHVVEKGETMANIAKQYDVGFLALMAANKGVDPFLPQEGYVLSIPSEMVLPPVEYQGIVINLAELRLYYFEPELGKVHVFPVGIGRVGRDTPEMVTSIREKRPNPTWTPLLPFVKNIEKKASSCLKLSRLGQTIRWASTLFA